MATLPTITQRQCVEGYWAFNYNFLPQRWTTVRVELGHIQEWWLHLTYQIPANITYPNLLAINQWVLPTLTSMWNDVRNKLKQKISWTQQQFSRKRGEGLSSLKKMHDNLTTSVALHQSSIFFCKFCRFGGLAQWISQSCSLWIHQILKFLIHVYIYMNIHIYTLVCVCVCLCVSLSIYIYVYIYLFNYIYILNFLWRLWK